MAHALATVCFCAMLAVVTITDMRSGTIPNQALLAALAVGVLALGVDGVASGQSPHHVLSTTLGAGLQGLAVAVPAALLSGLLQRITGATALGGGDIKLMFVAGCYLGLAATSCALLLACVAALVFAAATRTHRFPFAPAIAFGCVTVLCLQLYAYQ